MATFNGELYISQLIESLINQTYDNWRLLVHDDGSTDSSVEIILKYKINYPDKINLLIDSIIFQDSTKNFNHLINNSISKYIFFCDQDDVWLPNKIENSFKKMREMEEKNIKSIPVLVFSDLMVVDSNLNQISSSFWESQNIYPRILSKIKFLGVRNCVTGNTALLNENAIELYRKDSNKNNITHDWNAALLVKLSGGQLYFLNEQLTQYRIHDKNSIGISSVSFYSKLKRNFNPIDLAIKQIQIYNQIKCHSIYVNIIEFILVKFFVCVVFDLIFSIFIKLRNISKNFFDW